MLSAVLMYPQNLQLQKKNIKKEKKKEKEKW